jgi:hypothetical protein
MTDRELLEKSAKAAGIKAEWHHGCGNALALLECDTRQPRLYWNPLTDDGDALRLAVKLDMSVEISDHEASTYAYAGPSKSRTWAMELWRDDKASATRRAIVRAAASLADAREGV